MAHPRRRWFAYSLRTLFVVVTMLCVALAWRIQVLRERDAVRALVKEKGGLMWIYDPDWLPSTTVAAVPYPDPWLPRLFSDTWIPTNIFVPLLTPDELERVKRAFPEAQISRNVPHPG